MKDYLRDFLNFSFLILACEDCSYFFRSVDVSFTLELEAAFLKTLFAEWVGEKVFCLLLLIPFFPALAVSLLAEVVETQVCCQKSSTILNSAFLHLPHSVATVICELHGKINYSGTMLPCSC